MLSRNLTAKILVAVGVAVAVVIAIYTYFVIRVQGAWWQERTTAQNLIAATMVHEYLNGVMLSDRHAEVQGFMREMQLSHEIHRGRIIKPDGTVVFSTEPAEAGRPEMSLPAELFRDARVLQGQRREGADELAVVMRPVLNGPSCRTCHATDGEYLGAIVLEKSLAPAQASIAANRNLLIAYGVIILVLVGVVLWLLLLRLVTQPVNAVLRQMQRVQQGDLRARAPADSRDEIGRLAAGFNAMVGSLEETQRELRDSHDKQIQQAGKLASIGELASGIAHEIRNPLAGIGAAVEVLADDDAASLNGQRAEIVGEIHQQIKRLNTTLHDLLGFARQREPETAPCELRDILKPMLALVRPDAQKQQITIVEDYAADLPLVNVDAPQIQQVVLNLLLNALQAMPEGGTLTIAATGADQRVRLAIRDTGPGIPAEIRAKIFSPFFTTKHRGTGLGLAIARSIIEKHNGALAVVSEVGRGSTFTLELAAAAPLEETLRHGTRENSGR